MVKPCVIGLNEFILCNSSRFPSGYLYSSDKAPIDEKYTDILSDFPVAFMQGILCEISELNVALILAWHKMYEI